MTVVRALRRLLNARALTTLSDAARFVYVVLAIKYRSRDGLAFPRVETLAADTGYGQTKTRGALAELRRGGWLEVVSHGGGRTRRGTAYRVHLPDWTDDAERRSRESDSAGRGGRVVRRNSAGRGGGVKAGTQPESGGTQPFSSANSAGIRRNSAGRVGGPYEHIEQSEQSEQRAARALLHAEHQLRLGTEGECEKSAASTTPKPTALRPRPTSATVPPTETELAVYAAYPRKVGRGAALKAIRKALARVAARGEQAEPAGWLLDRVEAFATSPAGQAGKYTPHPATWFNQDRFDDDPAEWQRGNQQGQAGGAKRWGQQFEETIEPRILRGPEDL